MRRGDVITVVIFIFSLLRVFALSTTCASTAPSTFIVFHSFRSFLELFVFLFVGFLEIDL